MYSVEDIGLIKIDLLSQRSLGVIKDAMNEVNNNHKTSRDSVIVLQLNQ